MDPLLAATDFSPSAANAAAYAFRLAGETGRKLILFHADPIPLLYPIARTCCRRANLERSHQLAEQKLIHLRERLKRMENGAGPEVSLEARRGHVIGQLESVAVTTRASLIVVGTRGHTGPERMLFGSTSARAIRKLSKPVLAVPPGAVYQRIRRIGLACDFQDAHRVLPTAEVRSFLTELGAELHILHVDHAIRSMNEQQKEQMNYLRDMFKDHLLEFHFITAPSVEGGINEAIREWGLDLIMTLPKKHGRIEKLFHRSHSGQMLLQANVPVLFLRMIEK